MAGHCADNLHCKLPKPSGSPRDTIGVCEDAPSQERSCTNKLDGAICQVCKENEMNCLGECFGGDCVGKNSTTEKTG